MRKLNEKGSFIIWFTLAFALLGTFVGFAVDFGRAYLQKARLARLVDAAAIVAAKTVKGQEGNIAEATKAACDSMVMNGAPVVMASDSTCVITEGAPFEAEVEYFTKVIQGGPPMTHVRIRGREPVPTTFLRFLGWMVPGDYSTINVAAIAEAAPERPIDLVLVLDRSESMVTPAPPSPPTKLQAMKNAVNAFLDNTFSGADRVGMVSFAWRGCGNNSGIDSTAATCQPDVGLQLADTGHIATLKTRVNGLATDGGGTNTMEAIRTARTALQDVFNDSSRAQTRKVMLLVTDGKPTAMRRMAGECTQHPKTGNSVPDWPSAAVFNNGCILAAYDNNGLQTFRRSLDGTTSQQAYGDDTNNSSEQNQRRNLFQATISCIRALAGCTGTSYGAMKEAHQLRNCGYGNSGCGEGGPHDVLVFVIGMGIETSSANSSFDKGAKCMLARIANSTDVYNTGNHSQEMLSQVCSTPQPRASGGLYNDQDPYTELLADWPSCSSGAPCINEDQQRGRVYIVDPSNNLSGQLAFVFNEIAALLKLRLTL